MDHQEMQQKIYSFYDGELPLSEELSVKQHLDECAECRELIEDWRTLSKKFFSPPLLESSEEFVERVMDQIEEPRLPWFLDLRKALIPLAGFGLIALFIQWGSPMNEVTPTIENLLMADSDESIQMVISDEKWGPEELLGSLREEE